MTRKTEIESMTDETVNAMVRKNIGKLQLGTSLSNLKLGKKIILSVPDRKIWISGKTYKMDKETEKFVHDKINAIGRKKVEHMERREKSRKIAKKVYNKVIIIGGFVVIIGGIGGCIRHCVRECKESVNLAERKRNIQEQVEAYAATLPNYDDSIRLAKTDEELQNAINHREQARLKIAHYNDSLCALGR
ncbi:MAG: hypothetical protein J6S80_03990 [Alphaproteobacteria bacterium]|nr:hypothetical protein [Alphaproteobacteria bacterium]